MHHAVSRRFFPLFELCGSSMNLVRSDILGDTIRNTCNIILYAHTSKTFRSYSAYNAYIVP